MNKGFLHPLSVRLGIPKSSRVHCGDVSNLLGSPVPDEQRLATPLEGHVLALRDVSQLHLNLGQGQHILRCAPGHDKEAERKKREADPESNPEADPE